MKLLRDSPADCKALSSAYPKSKAAIRGVLLHPREEPAEFRPPSIFSDPELCCQVLSVPRAKEPRKHLRPIKHSSTSEELRVPSRLARKSRMIWGRSQPHFMVLQNMIGPHKSFFPPTRAPSMATATLVAPGSWANLFSSSW